MKSFVAFLKHWVILYVVIAFSLFISAVGTVVLSLAGLISPTAQWLPLGLMVGFVSLVTAAVTFNRGTIVPPPAE